MPEPPEVNVWAEQIRRMNERLGMPDFELHAHPRTWPAKSKYQTCRINSSSYSPPDLPALPHVSKLDISKSTGKAWEYLLRDPGSGPLYAHPRGKQLVIACGKHASVISFALEAHIIGMKRSDYDEIISVSVPSDDIHRGHLHHSFVLPTRFRESNSSTVQLRQVRIFLAWVSDDWVWALSDFSRLVQFYIISRDTPWGKEDIAPGSNTWPSLWTAFPSGPDWNFETQQAIQCTRDWRRRTLAKKRVSFKPIINILGDANEPAFFAFGRHTVNDFLHSTSLFPGCPAIWICSSNARFERFLQGIIDYMRTWVLPKFLTVAGGICNSHNPFAYNYKSYRYYRAYILVFRRSYTYMPRQLYNSMLRAGLFNPKHHIGDLYTLTSTDRICIKRTRRVSVYFREGLDCYTVIRARAREKWKDGIESPAVDLQFAGYATTIGLAEFHESKVNRLNYDLLLKNPSLLVGTPGRKPKCLLTGAPGRPIKELTAGQKRKLVDSYAKSKQAAGISIKQTKVGGSVRGKKIPEYFK